VAMPFGFVVTLVPVAIVFGFAVPIETALVVEFVAASVRELVPIEVPKLPVLAGGVDPGVLVVVPVEVTEVPVLPGVVDGIEFVCPLRLAVFVP